MGNVTQSSSGTRRRSTTHIDMTPMVDLAFLLLTFFVLTTSLNKSFVLPISVPVEDPVDPPPVSASRVLTLLLGEHDNIYWYQGYPDHPVVQTSFGKDGIRKLIHEKEHEIPNMIILVKATKKARYKNVVDVVDEMTLLKDPHYALVDITKDDENLLPKTY